MKNRFFYLLNFVLLTCVSCQESYPEAMIQQQLLWKETIERSNLVLKKNNSLAIEEIKAYTKNMTQYHAFYPKFKYITTLANSLYDDIDHLKDELIEYSGNYSSSSKIASKIRSTIPTLTKNIQSIYHDYIYLMEHSWDNGGIKGTVSADISKKENRMDEIKATLELPFLHQIRANPVYLEQQLKDKSLAAILTLLSSIQSDIRKQESHVFDFFARQVGRICNFGWSSSFGLFIRPNKFCIRLGETYKTEFFWGSYSEEVRSIIISGDSLSIEDERAKYTIQTTQVGEQAYRPLVTFLNPYTNCVDSLEKTFYFDVIDSL